MDEWQKKLAEAEAAKKEAKRAERAATEARLFGKPFHRASSLRFRIRPLSSARAPAPGAACCFRLRRPSRCRFPGSSGIPKSDAANMPPRDNDAAFFYRPGRGRRPRKGRPRSRGRPRRGPPARRAFPAFSAASLPFLSASLTLSLPVSLCLSLTLSTSLSVSLCVCLPVCPSLLSFSVSLRLSLSLSVLLSSLTLSAYDRLQV